MSRIPQRVVDLVHDRASGYCEACSWPGAGKMDLHHRLPRSRGGTDIAANLIYVHHTCHVVSPWSIHQNPKRSYRLGHTLHTGEDPELLGWCSAPNLRDLRA